MSGGEKKLLKVRFLVYFVSAGGDQGVLNSFFNTWATADISKHLPFIYNLSSISIYSYLPAFKQSAHTNTHLFFHGLL